MTGGRGTKKMGGMKDERKIKLEEGLREEIASLVARNFRGEGFGLVTITRVELNLPGKEALVFVYAQKRQEDLVGELKKNFRKWHKELVERVKIKYMPRIEFRLDLGVDKVDRIEKLLRDIKNG